MTSAFITVAFLALAAFVGSAFIPVTFSSSAAPAGSSGLQAKRVKTAGKGLSSFPEFEQVWMVSGSCLGEAAVAAINPQLLAAAEAPVQVLLASDEAAAPDAAAAAAAVPGQTIAGR